MHHTFLAGLRLPRSLVYRRKLSSAFYFLLVFALVPPAHSEVQEASDPNGRPSNDARSPTEVMIQGAPFYEPLRVLPQSATVLEGEASSERGVHAFQDTLELIPAFSFSGGTSRPRFFLIRGVGELEQYESTPNPSVATIIDDIDFSGLGIVVPFFDIDRVEVLRGPQGIRYGANGLAGAIAVRTNDPAPFATGEAELSVGNDDLRSVGAAAGGAVPGTGSDLQIRASAFSLQSDGFRTNDFYDSESTNGRDEEIGRLKVRYEPSRALTVDFAGWVSNSDNGYDAFAIDNTLHTQSDRPGEDDLQVQATSMKVAFELTKDITLENIASAANAEQDYSFDGDWGNNPFWGEFAPYDYFSDSGRRRRMLSEEIRLTSNEKNYTHGESWRWLVGGFAQKFSEDTATAEFSDGERFDFLASEYDADTGALFAQAEAPLLRSAAFALGTRVERRVTEYSDSRDASFAPGYTLMGGSATLTYDLTDESRLYASGARGFKPGGVNAGPSVPEGRRTYDPEYLWNFETGVKSKWLSERVTTNVALFHQRRRDQQLKFGVQDDPSDPLSFTFITESRAEGESSGLEAEGSAKVTERWELFGSVALLESEFTSVPAESGELDGREFSHAPDWQYVIGSRLALTEHTFARVEVTGRDSFYFDDSHDERSEPYHLLNGSIGHSIGPFTVTLWGRNLLDERYAVRGFYFGNEPPDFPNKEYIQLGDPRTFGVTATYHF